MPGQGTHRKSVVLTLPDSKLLLEILERKEFVGSIEFLIIFAVTALYLAIVSWSERTDQLVADSQLSQSFFKEGSLFRSRGV